MLNAPQVGDAASTEPESDPPTPKASLKMKNEKEREID